MAKNLIQDGTRMSFINNTGSAIASGQVVPVGNQLGVAVADIAIAASGELAMDGVYECPKASASAIGQGEDVLWDVSASEFDNNGATPATGDIGKAAVAWAAAGAGVTTVQVKLNLGVGTLT